MASMPMDDQLNRGGNKPPVSAHPAFPAVVALWFAALLGLGSLILPVHLVERIVTATGIASLAPAAAPPLGFTARAAIALVATVFGAAFGFVAARRITRPARHRAEPQPAIESGRRFLNPAEDIADDGIAAPETDTGAPAPEGRSRRRPLALAEEEGTSDFLNVAPLPGGDEITMQDDAALFAEPLELATEDEFADDEVVPEEPIAHEAAQQDAERQEFIAIESPVTISENDPAPERQEFSPANDSEAVEPLPFSPPSMARQNAPEPDTTAATEAAEEAQPMQVFQPVNPVQEDKPEEAGNDETGEELACETADSVTPEPTAQPGEGLVQLVQKLGDTLAKHREWSAQRAAQWEAGEEAAVPQAFEAAAPDDAAEAIAAYFKPVAGGETAAQDTPRQGGYAPLGPDIRLPSAAYDDEDDVDEIADLAASFSLPLHPHTSRDRETARPGFSQGEEAHVPQQAEFEGAETETQEDHEDHEDHESDGGRDYGYAALQSVENPFKWKSADFVRIEEPEAEETQPSVVFPNDAAAAPAPARRPFDPPEAETGEAEAPRPVRNNASNDDNERALREALMNLQRMGK